MSLFDFVGPAATDAAFGTEQLNAGPQLQFEGGPASDGPTTTVPRELQVIRPYSGPQFSPAYPPGADQPFALFTVPPTAYQSSNGSGLITQATQDWFDANVARPGGPVTTAELDAYLLAWADDHIVRPAVPIASDEERASIMRAIGIPLGNPGSMSTIPVPPRAPAQPTGRSIYDGPRPPAIQRPEPLTGAIGRLAVDTTAIRTAQPTGAQPKWLPLLLLAGLAVWALA